MDPDPLKGEGEMKGKIKDSESGAVVRVFPTFNQTDFFLFLLDLMMHHLHLQVLRLPI